MNDEIKSLLDAIRRGQFENSFEKISLLAAALVEGDVDAPFLLSLIRAPQVPIRLAVIEASRNTKHQEIRAELAKLVVDRESQVRENLAELHSGFHDDLADDVLRKLIGDSESDVKVAALRASEGRPSLLELQMKALKSGSNWAVRNAAAVAIGKLGTLKGIEALFGALVNERDEDIQRTCVEIIENRFERFGDTIATHLPSDIPTLGKAAANCHECEARAPVFISWLHERTRTSVDTGKLSKFGTDLTALAESGALPRGFCLEESLSSILELLRRESLRSIALIGKSGVGKSSIVNELVSKVAKPENGGWRVIRVSPTDFMVGTKYLGEWETKLRDLVDAVKLPRRVLVYVPKLADLSAAGRSSKSDSNVLAALAPYLEEGSVILIGESTAEEFQKGFGKETGLQRLFDKVLVEESSKEHTLAVLSAIRDQSGTAISNEVLYDLFELAGAFPGNVANPGNAAVLLRSVIASCADAGSPVSRRDVIKVLSTATGVPVDLLDDGTPLEITPLRAFFEKRIMGQPEAVEAVVDVVTMVKAGLTDPNKPFSVMMFVGPTGVGKTELARALAEYVFGNASRLLRFDMSEYASPESFTRLIGGGDGGGLLTDAVSQRPFSVVLLDEIEKSHVNVFDLCLQIFDAGRLTDGGGRIVDFRRTVVILTSNIGAEIPGATVGFGNSGNTSSAPADKERTFRELSRFFRPEFLNRLDNIINFRPLSLEVAERIARRELELVIQRSGIVRRDLTVMVARSVISLLVREGYSAHLGARPLKRTVERMVLLPLSRTIASGKLAKKSLLSLSADSGKMEVKTTSTATKREKQLSGAEAGRLSSSEMLRARLASLESRLAKYAERKSELVEQTRRPDFYRDETTRTTTFEELHKIEEFVARCDRFRHGLDWLHRQLTTKRAVDQTSDVRDRAVELSSEMDQIEFIANCTGLRDLCDAYVTISIVKSQGDTMDPVESLAKAYLGLSQRRNMDARIVGEHYDSKTDVVHIRVLGLGAFALLAGERGLHDFRSRTRSKNPRNGREQIHEDTATLRVDVVPIPNDSSKGFGESVKTYASVVKPPKSRLLKKAGWSIRAFHEPSVRSVEAWFEGGRGEALQAAVDLLHALVHSDVVHSDNAPGSVRRYDLGIGSRIKDLRTGRTTTRLAHFFRGQMEMLLPTSGAMEKQTSAEKRTRNPAA